MLGWSSSGRCRPAGSFGSRMVFSVRALRTTSSTVPAGIFPAVCRAIASSAASRVTLPSGSVTRRACRAFSSLNTALASPGSVT